MLFPRSSGQNTSPRQNMPHPVIDRPSCDSPTAIRPIPSPPTVHEHEQDYSSESRCVLTPMSQQCVPIPLNALWSMLFS